MVTIIVTVLNNVSVVVEGEDVGKVIRDYKQLMEYLIKTKGDSKFDNKVSKW